MPSMEPNLPLASMLFDPKSEEYNVALTYIIYQTVRSNPRITLNKLLWLLASELLLKEDPVRAATMILIRDFGAVSRWTPRGSQAVHLTAVARVPERFATWLATSEGTWPQLKNFVAPIFTPSASNPSQ